MPNTTPSSARSWLMLLLAGGFEVGYALSVGGSNGFTRLSWSLVAVVFFLLTLYALSVALQGHRGRDRLRRLGRNRCGRRSAARPGLLRRDSHRDPGPVAGRHHRRSDLAEAGRPAAGDSGSRRRAAGGAGRSVLTRCLTHRITVRLRLPPAGVTDPPPTEGPAAVCGAGPSARGVPVPVKALRADSGCRARVAARIHEPRWRSARPPSPAITCHATVTATAIRTVTERTPT